MDTLMQVLSEEPLPPSRLQMKLPRDLSDREKEIFEELKRLGR